MEFRQLGRTGIRVSLLGLGTVKLGRDEQVKYPDPFRIPDDRAARALLDRARDLGINLIDTAPAYGRSEERLGALLAGERNHWVLCTKVGETFEHGRSRFDFSPRAVQQSVARSLERLRTDRLDLVLIHSDGNDLDILDRQGTLAALDDLRRRGWIRATGISHKTVAGATRALELDCQVVMATLNLAQSEEAALIARAGEQGCGVLIKKALASGHSGLDSLRYVARAPGVSSIVVGTIDPDHLAQNVAAVAGAGADPR